MPYKALLHLLANVYWPSCTKVFVLLSLQDSICQALDSMLGVCHRQTELLALCKGSEHAEKVALLHLSATGDIVHSLNRGVDVQKCDAFTKKKATAVKRPSQQQPEMRPRSQPHPEHQPANGGEVLHREWTLLVAVLTAMMLV